MSIHGIVLYVTLLALAYGCGDLRAEPETAELKVPASIVVHKNVGGQIASWRHFGPQQGILTVTYNPPDVITRTVNRAAGVALLGTGLSWLPKVMVGIASRNTYHVATFEYEENGEKKSIAVGNSVGEELIRRLNSVASRLAAGTEQAIESLEVRALRLTLVESLEHHYRAPSTVRYDLRTVQGVLAIQVGDESYEAEIRLRSWRTGSCRDAVAALWAPGPLNLKKIIRR